MQRLAHDDIAPDEYLRFVAEQRDGERVYCLYASDAEVFGFRPGRYRTNAGGAEWARIAAAFAGAGKLDGARLVTPSAALETGIGGHVLRLETAAYPVPVKKQRKYNVTRWAVSGRDDIGVNAACQRIFAALLQRNAPDSDWRELCRLWASDFRTHITQKRWDSFCANLQAMEQRLGTSPPAPLPARSGRTGGRPPHPHRNSDGEGATGPPPRSGDFKRWVRAPTSPPWWAAFRTARSMTSRCRPTGIPATACSRRRANTR